jgi:hypothetical protein
MSGSAVTNRKLDESGAGWAPFRGWSVLFDPPGAAPAPSLLSLDPAAVEAEPAYGVLAQIATDLVDLTVASASVELVVLPASTYHVTICDGLAEDRVAANDEASQQLLDELPASLADWATALDFAAPHLWRLLAAAQGAHVLDVDSIEVRGHAVVAALSAARDTPGESDDALVDARDALLARLGEHHGADVGSPWRPHVTLAYLRRREDGALLASRLAHLGPQARDDVAPLTFSSASLYAFTDMVTYWRLPTPEPATIGAP